MRQVVIGLIAALLAGGAVSVAVAQGRSILRDAKYKQTRPDVLGATIYRCERPIHYWVRMGLRLWSVAVWLLVASALVGVLALQFLP